MKPPAHPDLARARQLPVVPDPGAARVLSRHRRRAQRRTTAAAAARCRGATTCTTRRSSGSATWSSTSSSSSRAREWETEQHDDAVADAQRRLPRIYLEHDPPLESPTDQRHWVDDRNVTARARHRLQRADVGQRPRFAGRGDRARRAAAARDARYSGHAAARRRRGEQPGTRGRRLGPDVFLQLREQVPLTLVGMGVARARRRTARWPTRTCPAFMAALPLLLQPDPLHQPGAGGPRSHDGRPAHRRPGHHRDVDRDRNGVNGWLDTRRRAAGRRDAAS